eukprot:Em0543g2a
MTGGLPEVREETAEGAQGVAQGEDGGAPGRADKAKSSYREKYEALVASSSMSASQMSMKEASSEGGGAEALEQRVADLSKQLQSKDAEVAKITEEYKKQEEQLMAHVQNQKQDHCGTEVVQTSSEDVIKQLMEQLDVVRREKSQLEREEETLLRPTPPSDVPEKANVEGELELIRAQCRFTLQSSVCIANVSIQSCRMNNSSKRCCKSIEQLASSRVIELQAFPRKADHFYVIPSGPDLKEDFLQERKDREAAHAMIGKMEAGKGQVEQLRRQVEEYKEELEKCRSELERMKLEHQVPMPSPGDAARRTSVRINIHQSLSTGATTTAPPRNGRAADSPPPPSHHLHGSDGVRSNLRQTEQFIGQRQTVWSGTLCPARGWSLTVPPINPCISKAAPRGASHDYGPLTSSPSRQQSLEGP